MSRRINFRTDGRTVPVHTEQRLVVVDYSFLRHRLLEQPITVVKDEIHCPCVDLFAVDVVEKALERREQADGARCPFGFVEQDDKEDAQNNWPCSHRLKAPSSSAVAARPS